MEGVLHAIKNKSFVLKPMTQLNKFFTLMSNEWNDEIFPNNPPLFNYAESYYAKNHPLRYKYLHSKRLMVLVKMNGIKVKVFRTTVDEYIRKQFYINQLMKV
jgi:hypothetical protein